MGVGYNAVKHAMLGKAGAVYRIDAAIEHMTVDIDLDQIRRRYFGIKKVEGIDQEGVFLTGTRSVM